MDPRRSWRRGSDASPKIAGPASSWSCPSRSTSSSSTSRTSRPEVASIGLSEEEARKRGHDVKVGTFPFSAIGKAKILQETGGFVKIVSEKKYDEVLGVHIIGPHATELISEATAAAWAGPVTREMALPVSASVRLISACQDNQVAMDGLTNGLFTGRLLEAWGEGAFQGDYAAFHRAIVERMPPDQTPNHYQTGQPSPAYAAQRPFDI